MQKCLLFQIILSLGDRKGARNVISQNGSSEFGIWKSWVTKLKLAWEVTGLNASDLSLFSQGPTLTPLTKGCPGTVCSILELGNRKKILGRYERLKEYQIRPGGSPVAPYTCRLSKTFTSGTIFPVPWCQAQKHALHPILYTRLAENGDFDEVSRIYFVHHQQDLIHPLHFWNYGSVWA